MAARLVIAQKALTYGTYAGAIIQLGFFGFDLYKLYRKFRTARYENSARARRSADVETVELVVKSRRRRPARPPPGDQAAGNQAAGNQSAENQPNQDQAIRIDENQSAHEHSKENTIPKSAEHSTKSNEAKENTNELNLDATTREEDGEVVCVYDSTSADPENQGPSTSCPEAGEPHEGLLNDDEILSTASTSLESTDSTNGIIDDIYKTCFICARSLYDTTKQVATLPYCNHPFHKKCLDGVLKWHPKCPVCDYSIFAPI